MRRVAAATLAILLVTPAAAETVRFDAADGLEVSAELYRPAEPASAAIVLFHQAGSSRGEYAEIGPRLARLGYLALAVDQRAGSGFGGVANQTAARAAERGVATGYADAAPDLRAAATYARDELGAGRVAVWGSSYSAALVIELAAERPGFADAVIAFSPGEWLGGGDRVASAAARLEDPAFLTSARGETGQWSAIFEAIPGPAKTAFRPDGRGRHGSSSLMSDAAPEYWAAIETFLKERFPPR